MTPATQDLTPRVTQLSPDVSRLSPAADRELSPVAVPPVPPRTLAKPNRAEKTGRIDGVDGARGIAILLVMMHHFSMYGHGLTPSGVFVDRLYERVAEAGSIGVDLFLVVSGFLITGILYDTKQSAGYFRNFYARRVLRIFPLYYCALLLFLVVLPSLWPQHWGLRMLTHDAPWYWSYAINLKISRDNWPAFGALGHFWSLALQEQFYLVWPAVVLLCNRRQLQITCIASIAAAFIVRVWLSAHGNTAAAYVSPPARMDDLALGALIAVTMRAPTSERWMLRSAKLSAPWLGIALLVMAFARRGFAGYDPIVLTVGRSLLAFLFGAMLILLLKGDRQSIVARVFESKALRFVGKYSYGMYIFHHPVLFFKAGLIPLTLIPLIYGSQLPRLVVFFVVASAVSLLMGIASWYLIEKQFLNMKALFPYRRPPAQRQSQRMTKDPVLASD